MTRTQLIEKKQFHESALKGLRAAYIAITEGGVVQYTIGSRSLTKMDLGKLSKEIAEHEKAIASCEAILSGGGRRRAVGVIPRDW